MIIYDPGKKKMKANHITGINAVINDIHLAPKIIPGEKSWTSMQFILYLSKKTAFSGFKLFGP